MTEIKIEKKSGSLWWLWLLLAIVIIGLLLWLFLGDDRDAAEQGVATPVETAAPLETGALSDPSMQAGGPITDIATLTGNSDGSLVGREVRLNRVPVGERIGDANFWINGADGEQVYVVLDEVRTPNTPIEGRVDIDSGDTINLVGTVRSADQGAPADAAMGSQTDPLPSGVTQYIYAQSATVVE